MSCCLKGKNNPMYRRVGKLNPAWRGEKPHCKICGKQLAKYGAKHCVKHANQLSLEKRLKNRKSPKGKNNAAYIDGRCSKKYYCKCGKKLSYDSIRKGAKQCQKCYLKSIKGKNHPFFGKHHSKKN